MAAQLENIDSVEIFAAGKWNGDSWSEKDLDEIVKSFYETKPALKPYLKLGHNEEQQLAQKDGLPSVGLIENLRRVGDKIVADFKKVPRKIAELIRNGAYSRVSSEIYLNIEILGKKFKKALKAVALLGGDTPAVSTLDDIMALYGSKEDYETIFRTPRSEAQGNIEAVATDGTAFKINNHPEANKMSDLDQIKNEMASLQKKYEEAVSELKSYKEKEQVTIDSLKKEVSKYSEEINSLRTSLEKAKEKEAELFSQVQEYKENEIKISVKSQVDKLLADKKITPAQKDLVESVFFSLKKGDVTKKYKIADKEVDATEALQKVFEINSVDANFKESTKDTNAAESFVDNESEAIHAKVEKYMKENKDVSYKDAYLIVRGNS